MHSKVSKALPAILDACQRRGVKRLDLFGSASRGAAAPDDYDFLVEFDQFPLGGYADAYFGLLEDLQKLLGGSVDLVVDSAIRNPYFRQSVDDERLPLYAA